MLFRSKAARNAPVPTKVIGFTTQMPDWMAAADLAVTKPGGLTTSEALATGLPLIVLNPIPGQEVKNANFLARANVARQTDSPQALPRILEYLLEHPQELLQMSANSRRLGKPDSAVEAARIVLGA